MCTNENNKQFETETELVAQWYHATIELLSVNKFAENDFLIFPVGTCSNYPRANINRVRKTRIIFGRITTSSSSYIFYGGRFYLKYNC